MTEFSNSTLPVSSVMLIQGSLDDIALPLFTMKIKEKFESRGVMPVVYKEYPGVGHNILDEGIEHEGRTPQAESIQFLRNLFAQ